MSANFEMSLGKQEPATANEPAKLLLETAKKRNGMIPNMYAHMANSPGLLSTYMHGYELFRKESGFTPAEQEVVFLTISYENGCAYCVAAHSVVADTQSEVPSEVTEAIRNGNEIQDEKLKALRSSPALCSTNAEGLTGKTCHGFSMPATLKSKYSK